MVNYVVGFFLQPVAWKTYQGMGLVGNATEVPVSIKDVGYCFAQLAGLLNLLVVMDAYDTGVNDELFEAQFGRSRRTG